MWPDSLASSPRVYLLLLFSILQFICGQLSYPFPASCYWSFSQLCQAHRQWRACWALCCIISWPEALQRLLWKFIWRISSYVVSWQLKNVTLKKYTFYLSRRINFISVLALLQHCGWGFESIKLFLAKIIANLISPEFGILLISLAKLSHRDVKVAEGTSPCSGSRIWYFTGT